MKDYKIGREKEGERESFYKAYSHTIKHYKYICTRYATQSYDFDEDLRSEIVEFSL